MARTQRPEVGAIPHVVALASDGKKKLGSFTGYLPPADLVARLEKKTGRKVKASVRVDKDLIAGVKVILGDKVIDGSARAQLGALENALKA